MVYHILLLKGLQSVSFINLLRNLRVPKFLFELQENFSDLQIKINLCHFLKLFLYAIIFQMIHILQHAFKF